MHNLTRRQMLGTMTVSALSGTLARGQVSNRKTKATFVLVHGAWHGGWCWKKLCRYWKLPDIEFTPRL